MTVTQNRIMQLGILMLLVSFVFSGSAAFAAGNTTEVSDTKDICDDIETADDEQNAVADASDENDAEDVCEKTEAAKLVSQVDISEVHAREIAQNGYTGNGKITEVLLARDEDAQNVLRIVYEIEFTELDGTEVDVKVDANSGVYLGIDSEDDQDGEDAKDDIVSVPGSTNVQGLQMQLMSLLQQLIALLKA